MTPSRRVVLLAWELGAGLGHARRLLAVSQALQRRGFTPIVAARELWACTQEYRSAGIPVLQAPYHKAQLAPGQAFRARGYADLMAACGYQRVEALWPTVLAWDSLIELTKPHAIVADYSPILALAACGRVPMVAIGDGFVLPPPHLPRFPMVRRDGTAMSDETVLLDNAATVQTRRARPAPESLPALIGGQAHVVCTFPHVDVYADHRLAPATGPVSAVAAALPAPPGKAIFAYLAADFPSTAKLLQVLADTSFIVEAFVRDVPDPMRGALAACGVRLHDTPPALPEVLRRTSLVVHHGGVGVIEACLALGRPQLLLPRHLEQHLNASAVNRLGVGRALHASFSLAEARDLVERMVASDEAAERARAVAAEIAGPGKWRSLELIADRCEAFG